LNATLKGLSPLARGNPFRRGPQTRLLGPIPARAGQPRSGRVCGWPSRAYPRSRGATFHRRERAIDAQGLSPLARGNRDGGAVLQWPRGPIPARAGQPGIGFAHLSLSRAYPRSRGATMTLATTAPGVKGLSPLARGNRAAACRPGAARGPIPARAGQPPAGAPRHLVGRAYPRSRGATLMGLTPESPHLGLSPLARGNRRQSLIVKPEHGPIPARAGQPATPRTVVQRCRAYPRSRGATDVRNARESANRGLSPLARGNPALDPRWWVLAGPIPARAGQPHHHHRRRWPTRAYPRSRGATGCATVLPPLV